MEPADNLEVSNLELPARDPRGEAVKELEDMCAELVKTVHTLQNESRKPGNDRMVGRLEERIYTMTDAIHRRQRELYLNENIQISISHTQDGLPIRVNKPRKVNLWGI